MDYSAIYTIYVLICICWYWYTVTHALCAVLYAATTVPCATSDSRRHCNKDPRKVAVVTTRRWSSLRLCWHF